MRPSPAFLPIRLMGGIGDVIMDGTTAQYLVDTYKGIVYSPHAEALKYFYPDLTIQGLDMPDYTWYLEIGPVARFVFSDEFDGFLLSGHQELFRSQKAHFEKHPRLKEMVQKHPHQDFRLCKYARLMHKDRREMAVWTLGEEPPSYVRPKRVQQAENYITVHDGYDTQNFADITGRTTKQWDMNHWDSLIQRIRFHRPDMKIIQLGSKTSRPIPGVDRDLTNKTTLTAAFDILSKSQLHIDGDSGLVHASTRLGVPCVVMFGPTPDYFYGYSQNINIRTKICEEACYWTNPQWMAKCTLGYDAPKCMDTILPDRVLDAILSFL